MSQVQADPVGPVSGSSPRHQAPAVSRFWPLVAAVTVLAAVLGWWQLGQDGLWRDEIFSAFIATRSLDHAWSILWTREFNMGLYYLALWGWTSVSDSETWIRSLSVLAAVVTVPLTALVGRRLLGARAGLLAALLLTLAPAFLFYGRFARAYALASLLAVLACWLLLRAYDRPRSTARWAGYVAVCVLMVWTTPLTLLVAGAHALALLIAPPEGWRLPRTVAVYALVGLFSAPVLLRLLLAQGVMSGWIEDLSPARVAGAASDLSGAPVLVPVYALAVLAWGVALVRRRTVGEHPLAAPLLTAWLVLPPAVIIAVSVVKPLLVGRYLSFLLPVMALLLAWAVLQIRLRPLMLAALAVVVALQAVSLVQRDYLREVPEDVRGAAAAVTAQARPGDVVLYAPAHLRMAIEWYLDQPAPGQVVPEDVAVARTTEQLGDEFPQEFPPDELTPIVSERDRIWVVSLPGDTWRPTPESSSVVVDDVVRPGYEVTSRQDFGTIRVELFEAR
ncbi:hypothetical protein GB931_08445 [Modestobacter sp. I12A-02628]|uniref:Glycosyltransferase RgtA/B/C/D-like domain-containing protein n=1 Tax=Goekera deserti TaxID=2497753 RepID=A0A7K3WF13_9ACTN|nr:glycosyltransferase family 39 protein [Goekera deserti]MPQ97951.1 hypothetical protein [Goekera deserti]NDI48597.1 hypothetical protein [Goekera deserti]NEL55024.1 hypothetical protein [Goekera deserti]